jgi:hypothetical protein
VATVKTQWGDVNVPDDASDDQIDAAIDATRAKQTPQGPDQGEGFWSAFGRTLREQNVDPLTQLAHGIVQSYQQGGQQGGDQFLAGIPTGVAAGAWGASQPHTQAAIDAFNRLRQGQGSIPGNLLEMLGQGASALPVIGPQLYQTGQSLGKAIGQGQQQPYDQPLTQPYRQALGEAAGQGATLAGQLFPEDILEGMGAGIRKAAPGLYRKTAGFPDAMSTEEAKSAARLAVQHDVPLGGFLGVYGGPDEARAKLGKVIDENMAPINKVIQQHGNEQLDMNVALKDVTDEIDKWRKAPDGDRVAQDLTDRLGKFLKNKGLGIYDHETGDLVGWKPMTLRQSQELKQGAYGVLPSSVYSDASDAVTSGEKLFNQLIASGTRRAQNEAFPDLQYFNNNVHDALNLKRHITAVDKKGLSFGWPEMSSLGFGAAVGALGPSTGHPLMYSPEAMAAGGLLYALQKPQSASRVAIGMGDVGRGPASQLAAQTGRVAAGAKERQDFVDSLNQKFNLSQDQQLDTSQIPIAGKIPLNQIPMLVDAASRDAVPGDAKFGKLARAIATVESNMGQNQGSSSKGALGVMQLMPDAAKDEGLRPEERADPVKNIKAGINHLKKLYVKYKGDIPTTAAAYNFGQGNIDKRIDLPDETQSYMDKVLALTK